MAVACELASQRAEDAVVAVFAADHAVRDVATFRSLCRKAGAAAAQGYIVTLGIKPTHPATGYGYIRPGTLVVADAGVAKVEAFVEKPDLATAERYIAEGYLWNSGNFFFRADVMHAELHAFEPEIAQRGRATPSPARKRDLGFLALDKASFRPRAQERRSITR